MVAINKPPGLIPTSKLAQRLFDRHKLQVPVDIEELIKEYADIEEVNFPVNIDAILLENKDPLSRPKILVSKSLSKNRLRFTLAHELGHILIPWHVGTIFCHTDINYVYGDDTYRQNEQEANDFASELLINSDWIHSVISNYDLLNAFHILRKANVSDQAIIIKIQNHLPFNSAIALCESGDKIISLAENLRIHKLFDKSSLSLLRNILINHTQTIVKSSGGRNVILFQDMDFISEKLKKDFNNLISKSENEKDILLEILKSKGKLEQSAKINGIIGHANSSYPFATDYEFYLILIKTFVYREIINDFVSDSRFNKYCALKAKSLRGRLG